MNIQRYHMHIYIATDVWSICSIRTTERFHSSGRHEDKDFLISLCCEIKEITISQWENNVLVRDSTTTDASFTPRRFSALLFVVYRLRREQKLLSIIKRRCLLRTVSQEQDPLCATVLFLINISPSRVNKKMLCRYIHTRAHYSPSTHAPIGLEKRYTPVLWHVGFWKIPPASRPMYKILDSFTGRRAQISISLSS